MQIHKAPFTLHIAGTQVSAGNCVWVIFIPYRVWRIGEPILFNGQPKQNSCSFLDNKLHVFFSKAHFAMIAVYVAWQLQQNHTTFEVPFRRNGTQVRAVCFVSIATRFGFGPRFQFDKYKWGLKGKNKQMLGCNVYKSYQNTVMHIKHIQNHTASNEQLRGVKGPLL